MGATAQTRSTIGTGGAVGRGGPVVVLASSATCLVAAPAAIDDGGAYSWLRHTTSESAAQGVDGAWVARVGFVLFALGVAWTTARATARWGRLAAALHGVFAGAMLGVAAFSTRPWTGAAYDIGEDRLHSVFASIVGVAFALGVAAVARRRHVDGGHPTMLDVVAVATSVIAPTAMTLVAPVAGVAQRVMFAVAYAWYAREALADRRASPARPAPPEPAAHGR
ncbi:MAG: DUF998 domain-containing protein [Actinomycetota bacterium]|nr:DUF998 domain-containing protein [Actinomycetota bacterium]